MAEKEICRMVSAHTGPGSDEFLLAVVTMLTDEWRYLIGDIAVVVLVPPGPVCVITFSFCFFLCRIVWRVGIRLQCRLDRSG